MQFIAGGIGFFDSGIGGLTVLRACQNLLPNAPLYYLGDNARAPYGNLPCSRIRAYTIEALSLFETLHVRAVVLACNTVTAVCVEEMRTRFAFPIIGTEPAVSLALQSADRVGVLTTCATGSSARFQNLCKTAVRKHGGTCVPLLCDGLAKAVEENIGNLDFDYTPYLPDADVDGVVLGCTHYVWIKRQIERRYNRPTYDGNDGIARRLKSLIKTDFNAEKTPLDTPFCVSTQNAKKSPIFFLGGQKEHNKHIYEQMFV